MVEGSAPQTEVPPRGEHDDARLVARCRSGDQEAWSELVERFSRYVFAISVQGFRLSEADAEDVFQEVFARAYERLDQLRDDSALQPWLVQLTRRLCLDALRSETLDAPAGDVDLLSEVDAGFQDRLDEALTIRDALASLSRECQEVIDRFFARDQSYRMISAELEIPEGTVASRISRCLEKLRIGLAAEIS